MLEFRKAKSCFRNFSVGMVKNEHCVLFTELNNLLYIKIEFMDSANLLDADSDAIIFC